MVRFKALQESHTYIYINKKKKKKTLVAPTTRLASKLHSSGATLTVECQPGCGEEESNREKKVVKMKKM